MERLRVTLLGAPPVLEETDPEAYALYLQGRHLSRQLTEDSLRQSNELFEQALAIDPDYTTALDGLTRNYNNMTSNGLLAPAEAFARIRELTAKVLTIDPDNASAEAQLGWVAMYYDNDVAAAAEHFERALAREPANSAIIGTAAALLVGLGRLDEAIALGEYMVSRDPVNPTSHFNLGIYRTYAGHWEAAADAFRDTLRFAPGYIGARYGIGVALLAQDKAQAALEAFALEEGDEEYRVKGTALALHALGRQAEFRKALEELITRWGDTWPSEVAHVYAATGDTDAAFVWLDNAVAQNEAGLDHQFLIPFYAPVHDDPRWAEFLERVGSSPAQRASIEFEVSLPE